MSNNGTEEFIGYSPQVNAHIVYVLQLQFCSNEVVLAVLQGFLVRGLA
jgi:hypothetical protein